MIVPIGRHFNGYGFVADPASIQPGMPAAEEGYYADDGSLHHFILSVKGAGLANRTTPQSVIFRACLDAGGRLEVQGATYLPASVPVEFFNALTGERFGQITLTLERWTATWCAQARMAAVAPSSRYLCANTAHLKTTTAPRGRFL